MLLSVTETSHLDKLNVLYSFRLKVEALTQINSHFRFVFLFVYFGFGF